MKVGIIGGTGQMGTFFARVFTAAGHEVRVSGRRTELTNRNLAEQSDLVIISVPIHSTVPVIKEITPFLKKGQIVSDLTSIKSGPVAAMMESAADVIGMHPMFGANCRIAQRSDCRDYPGKVQR